MKLLIDLDTWLITHVFEPIGWKSEAHLKINCFALSRYLLTIGYGGSTFVFMQHKNLGDRIYELFISTVFWLVMILGSFRNEQRTQRSPEHQNAWKGGDWRSTRLLHLLLPIVVLFMWHTKKYTPLENLIIFPCALMVVCNIYFASCNPLPPGWKQERRAPTNAVLSKAG